MKNEKPEIFKNERALASAGSGKTYTLTNRFIALSLNSAPDRICALTFTRKSAAEFLDKILGKLSAAALDENAAQALSKDISALAGCQKLGRKDFLNLLVKIAKALPRIRLCTIDSFCSSLIKSFAPEMGIYGNIDILDSYGEKSAAKRTMETVFDTLSKDDKLLAEFAETVKRASFGKDGKTVFDNAMGYVKDLRGLWMRYPDESLWGNEEVFAADAANFDDADYLDALDSLRALGEKNLSAVVKYFEDSRPGNTKKATSKIFPQIAENRRENNGKLIKVEYEYKNKILTISDRAAELIDRLISNLLGGEIMLSCDSARAIAKILRAWNDAYFETSIMRGKMSFSDMPELLSAPQNRPAREIVEYKLDSRIDHWLFDEFQDTSRPQWAVFENLIGEILQGEELGRTFYYVGDVKQSIYGWRGGDPDLFDEIFKRYSPNICAAKPMNISYRSVPCVISAVNGLFGDSGLIRDHFLWAAADKWLGIWQDHISRFDAQDITDVNAVQTAGCVALASVPKDKDSGNIARCIYKLISEIGVRRRQLSCAVLVQDNKYAQEIAESLRSLATEEGNKDFPPVSCELDKNIVYDNPTCCAIAALASLLAHPEDTAARGYINMTPLRGFAGNDFELLDNLRNLAQNYGYATLVEKAAEYLLQKDVAPDKFTRERLYQMRLIARKFDNTRRGDAADFTEYLETASMRETSAVGTIEIMTIHKSKGLDFDVVFLPDTAKAPSRVGFEAVHSDCEVSILKLPCETICSFSPALHDARQSARERADFDTLCKFYVATTRAKRAVYFIREQKKSDEDPAAKKSGNPDSDFSKLLFDYFSTQPRKELSGEGEIMLSTGSDMSWYENITAREAADNNSEDKIDHEAELSHLLVAKEFSDRLSFLRAKKAIRPSQREEREEFGIDSLSTANKQHSSAREEGILVHESLAACAFAKTMQEALSLALDYADESEFALDIKNSVKILLKEFLSDKLMFEIFKKEDAAEVRSEEQFACVLSDTPVRGIFDRIDILRGKDGRPASARILEFKTDSAAVSHSDFINRHHRQARIYAESAAILLNLPPEKIKVVLISVRGRFAEEILIP